MFISAACEKEGRMALKKKTPGNLCQSWVYCQAFGLINVIESFSGWHVSGQTGGLWDFQEGLL